MNDLIAEDDEEMLERSIIALHRRIAFLRVALALVLVVTVTLLGAWGWRLLRLRRGDTKQSPSSPTSLGVSVKGIGKGLVDAGVIDLLRFEGLYAGRGGVPEDVKAMLKGNDVDLAISSENAGALLNVLWALGLAEESPVLTEGPMTDPRYGGAGNFASTGGWTLGKGHAMSHYAMHSFMALTEEEKDLARRVSKNIYRPCCDNATHFPDCNHGMAMLGLMELMASRGKTEAEMYRAALVVNSYWFPEEYRTIARYLDSRGKSPQSADPKEVLSASYSSGSGFRRIASLVPLKPQQGGSGEGGCSV